MSRKHTDDMTYVTNVTNSTLSDSYPIRLSEKCPLVQKVCGDFRTFAILEQSGLPAQNGYIISKTANTTIDRVSIQMHLLDQSNKLFLSNSFSVNNCEDENMVLISE